MPDTKKVILPVSGLHCKSCEMLIEDELKDISGVVSVNASQQKSLVEVSYDQDLDLDKVKGIISKLGYKVGADKDVKKITLKDYLNIALIFLVFLGIYLLFKKLAWFDFNLDAKSMTWPLVIVVGLIAGFSSCMSLVGGLVLGIAANYTKNNPSPSFWLKFKPHVLFNVGRISGYFLLGGSLGLLGEAFQLSITAISIITLLAALVMVFMGLKMTGLFPALEKVNLTLPKAVSRKFSFGKKEGETSWPQILLSGALTFFVPCGFTQAMQVYAISSANFLAGGLIMALFALGTTPGLLTLGGLVAIFKGKWLKVFYKVVSVLLIIFGILNIVNVLRLTGWDSIDLFTAANSSKVVSVDPNVKIIDGIQVVKMEENSRGYSPSSFTIIKGVPVKWVIDAKAPYSCASALVVKSLKIRKMLVAGENVVEFTPENVGKIKFSCSMGMYTGYFEVVEK
ncbi:MAG: sulfite exporter TauE/SafE family protein [Candidatus Falkowbacteria bacterium]